MSDSLTITDVESTIINNIDASAFTGALNISGLLDNYMTAGATIKGGTGANTIVGGAGGDTITTGKGADIVYGGQGYDGITTGAGADVVLAGTGQDSTPEADSFTLGGTWAASDTIAVKIFGKTFTQTFDTDISTTTLALKATIDADADISKLVTVSLATSNTIVTVTSKVDGNFTDFTWTAVEATGTSQSNTDGTNVDGTNSSDIDTVDVGTGADFVHTAGGADVIQLGAADGSADTVYILNTTEGGDVISGFEAGSGSDVIKFAGNLFENGTESATLQSITKTGTIAANYVFWEITTPANAGGVDTADEVATYLSGLTLTGIAQSDKVLLALNDGVDTYLWHYAEGDASATLDADELTLVGVLKGVTDIANSDLAYLA